MTKCGECVRHDNCWLYDEHKDDNGTCVWAESKSITESQDDVVESKDDVIEVVRCKDCRHGWYDDDIEYYTCRHPKGLNEELYGVDFCSYGERKE